MVKQSRLPMVSLLRRGNQIRLALGWSIKIGMKGSLCPLFPIKCSYTTILTFHYKTIREHNCYIMTQDDLPDSFRDMGFSRLMISKQEKNQLVQFYGNLDQMVTNTGQSIFNFRLRTDPLPVLIDGQKYI
jgi:hypothetical protein